MRAILALLLAGALSGAAGAAERSAVLIIEGMTCPLCGPTVKASIEQVDGVLSVAVSMDEGTATVIFEDTRAKPADLIQASENAGYGARIAP